MIQQILPVPVLADADAKGLRNAETQRAGSVGEARESNTDSRGGQKLLSGAYGSDRPTDDDELEAWLATLPRKTRFMLAMSVSALSLEKGQCRSRDDLMCFLSAAGLPVSRQAIENIECRALRKCRRSELAVLAKEHLTTK